MDIVTESELATMVMMSGCGGASSDPRIDKLKALPEVWRFDIADGWNVRVKISADIDVSCYMGFNTDTKQPSKYIESYAAYYCVYLNDDFIFANWHYFDPKYQIDYAGTYIDESGKVVFVPSQIDTYSDIECVSGERTVYNSSGILRISMGYKCKLTSIRYYLNSQGEWVPDEPSVVTDFPFSSSLFIFGDNSSKYIVNGGADFFHDNMLKFYYACTKLM